MESVGNSRVILGLRKTDDVDDKVIDEKPETRPLDRGIYDTARNGLELEVEVYGRRKVPKALFLVSFAQLT